MKSTIRDVNILNSINPQNVAVYLRAKGWHLESEDINRQSIWNFQLNEEEFEILLPLNTHFKDYPYRVSDILKTLEIVEKRTQNEIFETLTNVFDDIVLIRLNHPSLKDGTIPIYRGINFHRYAKDMLMSAACSTVQQKAYFERNKPIKATKYISEVRLGQSRRGSYILTLVSPVCDEISQSSSSPFIKELYLESVRAECFGRKVIEKLSQSLVSILAIAESLSSEPRDIEIAEILNDETLQQGVNANLCEAIVGINNSVEGGEIAILINPSPVLETSRELITQINFPDRLMPAIKIIRDGLKSHLYNNYKFTGEVIKLERQRHDYTGIVTIVSSIDDKRRRIVLELNEEQYKIAIKANQERRLVECQGDLQKKGNSYIVSKLNSFKIEENTVFI